MRVSGETKFLISTLVLSVLGGGIGVSLFTKNHISAPPPPKIPIPVLITASVSQVEGAVSKPLKLYVLVEFMDYQCPPCRANRPRIKNLVQQYEGKLQLVIRNMPLVMHPQAFDAAVAAEAAKEQNKFLEMHDALLTGGSLKTAEIQQIGRQIGIDASRFNKSCKGSARKRVKDDLKTAEALGLDSTPSWLLCTPEGKVWKLSSPTQVKEMMR